MERQLSKVDLEQTMRVTRTAIIRAHPRYPWFLHELQRGALTTDNTDTTDGAAIKQSRFWSR